MDKLTQKIYEDYKSKVTADGMTHSVHYEMATALLNKGLLAYWNQLQTTEPGTVPPHYLRQVEARVEALIALITDMTVTTIELFLQEPDSMAYEPEEPDGIE
jgi:hypothetical protein